MKYMKRRFRPFFQYLARRKKRQEEQRLWQQLLAETQAKEMENKTDIRLPAIVIKKPDEDVPTHRLQRISSRMLEKAAAAEKAATAQKPLYCVLHTTPPANDTVRTTDPLASVPSNMLPNPFYIEHDRVLHMLRTHVESFVRYYGYVPRAIRVSEYTARVMLNVWQNTYFWHEIEIPLVCDTLGKTMPDDRVECIHMPGESGRLPGTGGMPQLQAPATERPTQRLRLSDLQALQLQAMK